MVIQRWQSVFLLLAAVAMAFFCFVPNAEFTTPDALLTWRPMGLTSATGTCAGSTLAYFIVNCVITVLIIIDIFLFKDLKRQMTVALVCAALEFASCITWFICVLGFTERLGATGVEWLPGIILLAASLLMILFAYSYMGKDRRKLANFDGLR